LFFSSNYPALPVNFLQLSVNLYCMKLTFLGTGTSTGVPSIGCDCETCRSEDARDKRLRVSILLEHAGKKILVDTSIDFRQQASARKNRLSRLRF
jgi:phosphoribosyl 1,2-cyclic phosphate phosphodiesterase